MATTAIRTILSLAATKDLELCQLDIETAFRHQNLKEEIFMEQPTGFIEPGTTAGSHVCKLNRVLYGLKQGAVELHKHLSETLRRFDYEITSIDKCVFFKSFENGDYMFGAIHVDDILCACTKLSLYEQFERELGTVFPVKNLGQAKFLLEMLITRNRENHSIHISQPGKVDKVLEIFGMSECKSVKTPFGAVDTNSEIQASGDFPYREAVGHLMYISNMTRPDLSFAVNKAARAVAGERGIMELCSRKSQLPLAISLTENPLQEELLCSWEDLFFTIQRNKVVLHGLLQKLNILLCPIL